MTDDFDFSEKDVLSKDEAKNWMKRLREWYDDVFIKPYFKCNDLNNDPAYPCQNKPKSSAEVGLKITF